MPGVCVRGSCTRSKFTLNHEATARQPSSKASVAFFVQPQYIIGTVSMRICTPFSTAIERRGCFWPRALLLRAPEKKACLTLSALLCTFAEQALRASVGTNVFAIIILLSNSKVLEFEDFSDRAKKPTLRVDLPIATRPSDRFSPAPFYRSCRILPLQSILSF